MASEEVQASIRVHEPEPRNIWTEPCPDKRIQEIPNGGIRSTDADDVAYDLISPIGLRRLAQTYREGERKYTACNWVKGFPVRSILNHVIRHIFLYLYGDRTEDHLAHAAWGLFTAMHFEETRPDLLQSMPDYTVGKQVAP